MLWEVPHEDKGLSSTAIRRQMLSGEPWEHLVPPAAARLLVQWRIPERLIDRLAAQQGLYMASTLSCAPSNP